ncbi:hypothetical protein BTA49_19710 [Pseudomonas mosselii]|nr:hypothetical protein BTA49_19710 [Pseudomonas mosselii]
MSTHQDAIWMHPDEFILVLPGLVLNYFGQGALILDNPAVVRNPFYLRAPEWVLLPMVALATLATIIASQAVISDAFDPPGHPAGLCAAHVHPAHLQRRAGQICCYGRPRAGWPSPCCWASCWWTACTSPPTRRRSCRAAPSR